MEDRWCYACALQKIAISAIQVNLSRYFAEIRKRLKLQSDIFDRQRHLSDIIVLYRPR